jgi:hypothetical protein
VSSAIGSVISAVQSLIGWLGKIKVPSIGGMLSSLNPFMLPPAPAPARYAAPAVGVGAHAVGGAFSTAGGAPIVINVTGALDPDAVARQIERILRTRSRRVGGVGGALVGVR